MLSVLAEKSRCQRIESLERVDFAYFKHDAFFLHPYEAKENLNKFFTLNPFSLLSIPA